MKALFELAALALDVDDAVEVLQALASADSRGRVRSTLTGEWLYVFKPTVGGIAVYVKVTLCDDCIVVSFHEDEENDEDSL